MNAEAGIRTGERRLAWSPAAQKFVAAVGPSGSASGRNTRGGFIKGPLPLDWMQKAARLPGKALQVALALWYLAGLNKSHTVRLASKPLEAMGVARDAKYDALSRLAAAGLIAIEQKPGQAPIVTLKDIAA